MELTEAIRNRRSIRGFRPEPVPQDTLRRVLELGTRAVSANNTQPWSFAVVTGEALERLRTYQMEKLAENAQPDFAAAPSRGPIWTGAGRSAGSSLRPWGSSGETGSGGAGGRPGASASLTPRP